MLTSRGLFLILLTAPLIAAATWIPLMEWAAWLYSFICLLLFLLDWRLAKSKERFIVSRVHDDRLSLGAENIIQLSITNKESVASDIEIRDEPPKEFETKVSILKGYLGSGDSWLGQYSVRPLSRGDFQFANLNLRWQGPFKLIVRQAVYPAEKSVKVYPNLLDIRRYDLLLKQNRLQEMGLRHTRMFGEGTEYERLREYLPDDDFRRINWKATARRNRPITIEYETERSQNIFLMLDTGRMMQSPVEKIAKLDYVINAALLLSYVAARKGDKVGLLTFSDQVWTFINPRQGKVQFYRLLEHLYRVKPQPVEPDFRKAFSHINLKHRKRALVVLFTDITGGLGIQSLIENVTRLRRKSLPLVVTISDPEIVSAAEQIPFDTTSAYQRAAAENLIAERDLTLETLHHNGILTLDVPANKLSLSVINRYLEIKGTTRL